MRGTRFFRLTTRMLTQVLRTAPMPDAPPGGARPYREHVEFVSEVVETIQERCLRDITARWPDRDAARAAQEDLADLKVALGQRIGRLAGASRTGARAARALDGAARAGACDADAFAQWARSCFGDGTDLAAVALAAEETCALRAAVVAVTAAMDAIEESCVLDFCDGHFSPS